MSVTGQLYHIICTTATLVQKGYLSWWQQWWWWWKWWCCGGGEDDKIFRSKRTGVLLVVKCSSKCKRNSATSSQSVVYMKEFWCNTIRYTSCCSTNLERLSLFIVVLRYHSYQCHDLTMQLHPLSVSLAHAVESLLMVFRLSQKLTQLFDWPSRDTIMTFGSPA